MRWIFVLLSFACALPIVAARAASLETHGQLPSLSDVKISPDGGKLAYAAVVQGKRVIVIQTLTQPPSVTALNTKSEKLRGLRWADSNRLLITTSKEENVILGITAPPREWWMTEVYDFATHKQRQLLEGVEDAMNVIFAEPEPRRVNGHPRFSSRVSISSPAAESARSSSSTSTMAARHC